MKTHSLRTSVDRVCRFRRIAGGGIRCAIEVTHRCNLACPHCFVERDRQQPSLEALLHVLRQLSDIGCGKAIITGGEPLVRADLERIVETCAAQSILVDLNSNLVAMRPARARSLLRAGMAEVSTSLYGDAATHDQFLNRQGAFERTLDGIRTLRALGVPVDVHCALWDAPGWGMPQVEYILRLCESLGCGSVTFFTLLPGTQGMGRPGTGLGASWQPGPLRRPRAQVLAHIRDVAGRVSIPVRTIGLVDDTTQISRIDGSQMSRIDGSAGDAGCAMASGIVGLSAGLELKPCLLARADRPSRSDLSRVGLAAALDGLVREVALGEWAPLCYQGQAEC